MHVSLITRHTAQKPDTVRWWGGVITIEDRQALDRGQSGTCESRDALDPPLSCRATYEAVDEGSHSIPFLCLSTSLIIANRGVSRHDTEVGEKVWYFLLFENKDRFPGEMVEASPTSEAMSSARRGRAGLDPSPTELKGIALKASICSPGRNCIVSQLHICLAPIAPAI